MKSSEVSDLHCSVSRWPQDWIIKVSVKTMEGFLKQFDYFCETECYGLFVKVVEYYDPLSIIILEIANYSLLNLIFYSISAILVC